MPTHYNFSWDDVVTLDCGEQLPADKLQRSRYASFLTNFLVGEQNEDGYVLNLNAQWGAGKTYFLKRWMYELKNKYPVVYIDAWKQDFSDDPLLTVMASIIQQLGEHLPEENQVVNNFSQKAGRFFKAAGPAIAKGMLKKISGIDADAVAEDTENANEDSESSVFDGSGAAEFTKALIHEHNQKLESVDFLRDELEALVAAVTALDNELECPTFIFIDELDRCRPSYAVEMLEVIKHFFNVKNIVFVVATDTHQLQHAIKAIYGEGFDAATYLGRFFKRRFSLNEMSVYDFLRERTASIPSITYGRQQLWPSISDQSRYVVVLSNVSDTFNLSLRETEQLCDRVTAVLRNANKSLDLYLLALLFVLHDRYSDIYRLWMEPTSTLQNPVRGTSFSLSEGQRKELDNKYVWFVQNYYDQHPVLSTNHMESGRFKLLVSEFLNMGFNHYAAELNPRTNAQWRNNYYELVTAEEQGSELMKKWNLAMNAMDLNAKKQDYRDWVELAVSFD